MTDLVAPARSSFRERLARIRASRPAARRSAPLVVGSVLAPVGVLLVVLAWAGVSRTPVLQEQIAYLVSGGIGGLCLVILGGLLYFSHWQTEQVQETRAQTDQVVAALREMTASLDRVAAAVTEPGRTGRLVATPNGTLTHRDTCQVVRRRTDLRTVAEGEPGLTPCRLCLPAGL